MIRDATLIYYQCCVRNESYPVGCWTISLTEMFDGIWFGRRQASCGTHVISGGPGGGPSIISTFFRLTTFSLSNRDTLYSRE